jgi:hypothetical protein
MPSVSRSLNRVARLSHCLDPNPKETATPPRKNPVAEGNMNRTRPSTRGRSVQLRPQRGRPLKPCGNVLGSASRLDFWISMAKRLRQTICPKKQIGFKRWFNVKQHCRCRASDQLVETKRRRALFFVQAKLTAAKVKWLLQHSRPCKPPSAGKREWRALQPNGASS